MKRKTKILLEVTILAVIASISAVYLCRESDIYAENPIVETENQKDITEKSESSTLSDKKNAYENAKHEKEDTKPEAVVGKKTDQVNEKSKENDDSDIPVSGDSEEKKGHYEERQVLVKDAYDETVLVRKGECSLVLVKDAYDTEEIVYLDGAYYGADKEEYEVCNDCGARFKGGISEHLANSETCGAWHNEWIEVGEPYWHNVEYRTIHHDAVYETQCETDEYTTVHHDAIYRTETVWIDD